MHSKVLKELIKAYSDRDWDSFRPIIEDLIEQEERKNHTKLANELRSLLNDSVSDSNKKKILNKLRDNIPIPRDSSKGFPLLTIQETYYTFSDLVLPKETINRLSLIIKEFDSRSLIATYGLKPKQKILFCGPPGTGKTLSASVISSELNLPLVRINLDSIISSYLGETATNLKKIFEFIEKGEWVVLFDEFDNLGKKRDDPYEHGEIKRIVNNIMQLFDYFDGDSIIIASTNHQQLLDKGLWRRFDDVIYFDLPKKSDREKLFVKYLSSLKKTNELVENFQEYITQTENFSAADIATICKDALKISIINGREELTSEDLRISINYHKSRRKVFT